MQIYYVASEIIIFFFYKRKIYICLQHLAVSAIQNTKWILYSSQ